MTTTAPGVGSTAPSGPRPAKRGPQVLRAVRRGWTWLRRTVLPSDRFALVVLLTAVTLCGVLPSTAAQWFPPTALVVPVLIGGLLLRMPSLLLLYAASCGVLLAQTQVEDPHPITPGVLGVIGAVGVIVLLMARMRTRLGVQGTRGESMLFDLRDRLQAQGRMPRLPDHWHTEAVLRPAGGESFSGDFLVATRGTSGRFLEIALVDVSGKGLAAGTRALLLSGAFGGLLGSLPPADFLPAANAYLIRQAWDEGFATAVHVVLDLETGWYELRSAGHPPGVQWTAGSGQWQVHEAEGPLLGVIDGAEFTSLTGQLDSGDTPLLFTDGMVEVPGQDISTGIDRLLGVAENLVSVDFEDGARRIVEKAGRNVNDDRAVVLIRCR